MEGTAETAGTWSSGLQPEAAEGGPKELVLRWFSETQAPLLVRDGNFPDWFQGLVARKDAEELLEDKVLGTFLIRLSNKAVGYILSYKGLDRCRHFMISQNQEGRFVIAGDEQTYRSLDELIQHYRASPIQPFGERLTSSCHQVSADELYSVVDCKSSGTPGVSVQALRVLWDQREEDHHHHHHHHHHQKTQQQKEAAAVTPPALPLKSKTRRLTGTVSAAATGLSQGLPPVPRRAFPPGFSLGGASPDSPSSETQIDSSMEPPVPRRDSLKTAPSNHPGDWCPPRGATSEPESRSKSPLTLDSYVSDEEKEEEAEDQEEEEEEEEEYSNQLSSSTSSFPPPIPPKRVTCHTYSLHEPRHGPRTSSSRAEPLHMLRSNPLYQSAERPRRSLAQQGDGLYAQLGQEPAEPPDYTYEKIPGETVAAPAAPGNTYESLEEMKTKKSQSTWKKNKLKWKTFFSDYTKK